MWLLYVTVVMFIDKEKYNAYNYSESQIYFDVHYKTIFESIPVMNKNEV